MTYEVVIEHAAEQSAAVVIDRVGHDQIGAFLGEAFGEVMQAAADQGLVPVGPPFARYAMDDDAFRVTAGFPVSGVIEPVGRVESAQLPGGELAVTVHVGAYEQLRAAFDAVIAWVQSNDRQIASDPWESYLDGPEVAEPRTKVCFPLDP